ncbi:MAG TPA: EAL domain-containing protein [Acidimicrobiia bacterium]|nr:EAL domain-containing protein [Acidimicrobiia bacterium]
MSVPVREHASRGDPEDLREQAARAELIADFTQQLSASLEDLDASAQVVAERVRAVVGDACVVSLVGEDGRLTPVGIDAPGRRARQALRDAYSSAPPDLDQGWARAVLAGETIYVPRMSSDVVRANVDPRHRDLVSGFPLTSLIIVPLTARGETFGSISTARASDRPPYTRDELQLVRDIADRAALAIDNARVYAANVETTRRLSALQQITDVAIAHLGVDDLLHALLERLARVMDADSARIRLVTDDQRLAVGTTVGVERADDDEVLDIGEGFAGYIAQTREPAIASDVDPADPAASLRAKGIRSVVGVPLLTGDHLVGVLHVSSVEPDRFQESDVELLRLAAERIAVAIERAQAEEAERVARDRELFLVELSEKIEAHDYETIIELLPRLLVPEVADWASIYAVDDAGGVRVGLAHRDPAMLPMLYELYWRYAVGTEGALPDSHRRSGIARVVTDVDVEQLESLATDERHRELLREADVRSCMIVPLSSRGRTIGVLTLVGTSGSRRRFDRRDLAFAREVADRCATALAFAQEYAGRLATQAALELSEERFRIAFEDAPIGMALVDLAGNDPGHIVHVNKAYSNLTGYSETELIGRAPYELTEEAEREDEIRALNRLVAGEIVAHQNEQPIVHAHGDTVWVHLTMRSVPDLDGRPQYAILQMADVTARRAAEERLVAQALHDPLTGLSNRRVLMDRLQHQLDELSRRETSVAVFYLDLDRFKRVNDDLGHEAGDHLLIEVSRRIETVVRPPDTVARLGGDEFVVVCGGLGDEADAIGIAERLLDAISEPVSLAGRSISVSPSIGVALTSSTDDDPVEVLRRADTAMYRAKGRGRACFEMFDERLRRQTNARVQMESDLRDALAHDRFRLYYQPIVSLEHGTIIGVEALLRLEHPTRGLIGPDEFIAVAEESGLIGAIGRWVLDEACRQLARWRTILPDELHELHMAVNVSGRQLAHPALAQQVQRALDESGVPPDQLCLEMTETVFMDAVNSVMDNLEALKARGIRLGIDDFGTGYSSLTYLRNFPVDVVKVDRSFVRELDARPQDQAIVSAVVELGHTLDLTTIAEGVETEGQLELLRVLGCDLAQGYHFARPRPADEVTELIRGRPAW